MMTTTTTTIDFPHPVHVVPDDRTYGLGWRAECACGWASDWHDHQADAETAGADHREVAAGPSDGLDRVMSELLDIQDELAAMVVWLAENWSAHLPVPTVYGFGGSTSPAHVELSVYCLDPADLTRIGHLLGVPPADDEQPDSHGGRYRTARRAVGRVTLRASPKLTDEPGPAA